MIQVEASLVVLALLVAHFCLHGVQKVFSFACPWGASIVVTITVSGNNPCGTGAGYTIVLMSELVLILGIKEGQNVVATKTAGGFSGASGAVELVSLVITVLGT